MFGTLFLGVVLASFFTLGVVRGDAERGLLQPLVVRPSAAAHCSSAGSSARPRLRPLRARRLHGCALITRVAGDWWPDEFVRPGVQLAAGCS